MKLKYAIIMAALFSLFNCDAVKRTFPESIRLQVENPAGIDREEAIFLSVAELQQHDSEFNPNAFIVLDGLQEIPSQANDLNRDGNLDQIVFVARFAAEENRPMIIRYAKDGKIARSYPKRTQAELSHKVGGKFVDRIYEGGTFQNVQALHVPPEHTDHSFYIRYEGPGWESDKVGYRFYLDWRNAIDIYGKKIPDMVLQDVGQDGFESYHEMSDWGMDILKVGESLGIGSIGQWTGDQAERVAVTDSIFCEIISNGPVQSQIRTRYYGWKVGFATYDLTSDLSITAGSRLTRHEVEITGNPLNLCTGIVKLDSVEVIQLSGASWSAFATWGKQSLANDSLGMAVLYRNEKLIEITGDPFSDVIVLRPADGKMTYYFLAAWEKEPEGVKTKKAFIGYLETVLACLDAPVQVTIE
jgi:hypothetical protein